MKLMVLRSTTNIYHSKNLLFPTTHHLPSIDASVASRCCQTRRKVYTRRNVSKEMKNQNYTDVNMEIKWKISNKPISYIGFNPPHSILLLRKYSNEIEKPRDNPDSVSNMDKISTDKISSESKFKVENLSSSVSTDKKSTKSNESPLSGLSSATARAANVLGDASINYTYEFNRLYTELEKSLKSKFYESNKRRLRIIVASVIVALCVLYACFRSYFTKTITDSTADIAKETLENESLKVQTQELAMAVVQTILNDKEITSHAANFLREASAAPETQVALLQLTLHVLQHPDSLKELGILVQKLLELLSNDPVAIKCLSTLLSEAISTPAFIDTIVSVLEDLAVKPAVVKLFSELLIAVAQRPEVLASLGVLLSETSKAVLADPKVINQSRDFVADVMGDDKIQKEGGDAIYNSISHALRPGLKKLGGFALIGASLALAQLLLSPY